MMAFKRFFDWPTTADQNILVAYFSRINKVDKLANKEKYMYFFYILLETLRHSSQPQLGWDQKVLLLFNALYLEWENSELHNYC